MSYTSIRAATVDSALYDRVTAAAAKEAWAGAPEFQDTDFGKATRDSPTVASQFLIWPTAIDYESEYSYAVDQGNPNPGGDPSVITDANIQASVQAHWPPNPWPTP